MNKKLIAALTAAALMISNCSVLFAEEAYLYDKDEDHSTISYDAGSKTVTVDGTGTVGCPKAKSSFPDRREEMVEMAGSSGAIEKIVFKSGITHIAGYLLDGDNERALENLKTIEFEEGNDLDEIGRQSFRMNPSLQRVYVGNNKGTKGESGYEISHYAFYNCPELSDVTLNDVIHVGKRAFYKDAKLTKVDLKYLHHMRGDAFEGCTSLSDITIDEKNSYFVIGEDGYLYKKLCPYYTDQNGLYNIVVPALMCAPAAKVPETAMPVKGTKTIAYAAFAGNGKIKTAKAVSGVSQIQARAFYDCVSLNSLYISKTVKHIGNEAFCIANTASEEYGSDLTFDDYDNNPYNSESDRVANGNVAEIYYSGSEEDWKAIRYDKYDKDMKFFEDGGTVAENMNEVGLSSNVIIHYNYEDPDIVAPENVAAGGKIASTAAAVLVKSKNITFDPAYLGFTPTTYSVSPVDGSPAKGLKVTKKGALKISKPGTYDVTVSDGSNSRVIRIFAEKPVMKKKVVTEAGKSSISTMLSGVTYNVPTKYESKKTAVAEIDENGTITAKAKGSTKITVYFGTRKFSASFKVKIK